MSNNVKRGRRTPEQLIQDLQARIEQIKKRAEEKKAKRSPALRHMLTAVKAIDRATASTEDGATRQALADARANLSACLSLAGVTKIASAATAPTGGRRTNHDVEATQQSLLDYVRANPGQRGEQISAAMNSDVKTLRLPMKKLIDANEIRTTGQRRGMRYYPR